MVAENIFEELLQKEETDVTTEMMSECKHS